MSNLGPLPTDFTITSECATRHNDIYYIRTTLDEDHHPNYLLQGPLEQTQCYPGGYTANTEQYYSPGRCPPGFTAPCQSTNRAGTVEETVLTCCPTQENYVCQTTFDYPWESTQGCVSHITTTSTELIVSKVSDGVTSRYTVTLDDRDGVNAYSIQVRYQSTDFISRTLSLSTPSSTIQSYNPTNVPHSTNGNGTITGVVIGVLAAIFIVAAAIFLLMRRLRRQKSNSITPTQYPHPNQQEDQAQQHQYFNPFLVDQETPSIQELDTRRRTAELDTVVAQMRRR
ncbi:hypothetical protein F5Y09DRAFT_352655 [Xylaria sp. FL1042]|nr:hypothetical protein F5Y09DRAFT_352655 [Xylaria sp. FL1042]